MLSNDLAPQMKANNQMRESTNHLRIRRLERPILHPPTKIKAKRQIPSQSQPFLMLHLHLLL
jgi:hypothetical protein